MKSDYLLAVDLGTSRTAAAIARVGVDGTAAVSTCGLGRSMDSVPSAIFISDGDLLFGEAAERRGLAQPERLVREFKRRIGDDVPFVVGDRRLKPEDLFARMVAWVLDAVAEREGSQPDAIIVTTPVAWGDYRGGLVADALAREISCDVELIAEPVAAARHYESTTTPEADRVLAVYDLGGGTFDTALLGTAGDGELRIVGAPTGIPDFGGADFDDLVLRHTLAAAGLSSGELSVDPDARVALATLRRECVEAKEALSFDSEAVIPVLVGQTTATVRLTRAEFEELIDAGVERTIVVLQASLEANSVDASRLEAILLTGGSSRIPRVAELLSERFDRPIAIDVDPKAVVALGAARVLADHVARRFGLSPVLGISAFGPAGAVAAEPEMVEESPSATRTARRRWFQRLPATAAMAGGALTLAGGMVVFSAAGLGNAERTMSEAAPASVAEWIDAVLAGGPVAAAEPVAGAAGPAPSVPKSPAELAPSPKEKMAPRLKGPLSSLDDERASATSPRTPTKAPAADPPGEATPATPTEDPGVPSAEQPAPDPVPDPTPDPPAPIPDPPAPDPDPPAPEPDPPAPEPDPTPDPPAPDPTPDPPAPEPTPDPTIPVVE